MTFPRSPQYELPRLLKKTLTILDSLLFGVLLGAQCIGWGFVILVNKQNLYGALFLFLIGILLLARSSLVKVYYETREGRRERKIARKKKRAEKKANKKAKKQRKNQALQA